MHPHENISYYKNIIENDSDGIVITLWFTLYGVEIVDRLTL